MSEPIHTISLGGGVQSCTLERLARLGLITPTPRAAIFADTHWEPKHVYLQLDELESEKPPFPILRVSKGSLKEEILKRRVNRKTGNPYYSTYIPAFVTSPNGKHGILRRKCTWDFKIQQIVRAQRQLIGRDVLRKWRKEHREALRAMDTAKKAKSPKPLWAWNECQSDPLIVSWIGISTDEAVRMRPSTEPWAVNRWPLIELEMSRADCVLWHLERGLKVPKKSACIICPYHDDITWLEMKESHPDDFAESVEFERDFQVICADGGAREIPYLHSSLIPLDQIDFAALVAARSHTNQISLFDNECAGICGV